MRAMLRPLLAILRDRAGVTAMEFALVLPILVILGVGTIEFGRMLLLSQKLQNGTFVLADLAARDKTLSADQLDDIFLALENVVQPFEFAGSGIAIVSSVSGTSSGATRVNWQRTGAGDFEATSTVGTTGGPAALPAMLEVDEGETIIVAEVFYDFEPLYGIAASANVLHKIAYVRPRLGTLETLAP
jgi:Flp pilus assembly protein TadG